jgi:hypothetical protein
MSGHVTGRDACISRGRGEGRREDGVRELRKHRVTCTPHFDSVVVRINDVFQMRGQRSAIHCRAAPSQADPLRNIEDNACEAIFVQVDLLVVWHLTDRADVRKGAGQFADKSPAKQWRAAKCCHCEGLYLDLGPGQK